MQVSTPTNLTVLQGPPCNCPPCKILVWQPTLFHSCIIAELIHKFNPDKTQCIRFSRLHDNSSCHFVFCGKTLECCRFVTHLGHTLTANLSDGDGIFRCSRDSIRKANGILLKFSSCDPLVLTKLLTCFWMSFYGCALWSLDSCAIKNLDVCINNCLQYIWSLLRNCHTSILHSVSGCSSVLRLPSIVN